MVILDRYIYTAYVRDSVRGHDIEWVKNLYNYAPEPDLVFYLDVSVDVLLKRIIGSTGLDYYESGRDIGLSTDIYNSFEIYQKRCIEEYKKLEKEYNFIKLNGELPKDIIHGQIKEKVKEILNTGIVK